MSVSIVRLRDVRTGDAFQFLHESDTTTYEHRGNGWYQIYGRTETGGPWHASTESRVIVEDAVHDPSQTLSCFV